MQEYLIQTSQKTKLPYDSPTRKMTYRIHATSIAEALKQLEVEKGILAGHTVDSVEPIVPFDHTAYDPNPYFPQ